jgi:CelD/BcsL family acetyltransferase involved in cellulose biosynthesis
VEHPTFDVEELQRIPLQAPAGAQLFEPQNRPYRVTLERGGTELLEKYGDAWRSLCAEGPCNEPFYQPEWVQAYCTSFAAGQELLLLIVRCGETIRGLLPLHMRSRGIGPLRLRWLHMAANVHLPRFDVIHGSGDAPQVAAALWAHLRAQRFWDLVQFESAPAGSVIWQMMELARQDRRSIFHFRPDASPYIDLQGVPDDPAAIIDGLARRLKRQCRKTEKVLEAEGAIEFQIFGAADSWDTVRAALQVFYAQEAAGWKGRGGTAILCDSQVKEFYDQVVADAHARGSLALCQLRVNDRPVAMQLNVVCGDRMYDLKSSYDETYQSSISPGHLAKVHTMAAGVAQGLRVYDNLGRAESHKLEWTSLSRPFSTGFISGGTLRGRAAWLAIFTTGMQIRDRWPDMWLPAFVKRMFE